MSLENNLYVPYNIGFQNEHTIFKVISHNSDITAEFINDNSNTILLTTNQSDANSNITFAVRNAHNKLSISKDFNTPILDITDDNLFVNRDLHIGSLLPNNNLNTQIGSEENPIQNIYTEKFFIHNYEVFHENGELFKKHGPTGITTRLGTDEIQFVKWKKIKNLDNVVYLDSDLVIDNDVYIKGNISSNIDTSIYNVDNYNIDIYSVGNGTNKSVIVNDAWKITHNDTMFSSKNVIINGNIYIKGNIHYDPVITSYRLKQYSIQDISNGNTTWSNVDNKIYTSKQVWIDGDILLSGNIFKNYNVDIQKSTIYYPIQDIVPNKINISDKIIVDSNKSYINGDVSINSKINSYTGDISISNGKKQEIGFFLEWIDKTPTIFDVFEIHGTFFMKDFLQKNGIRINGNFVLSINPFDNGFDLPNLDRIIQFNSGKTRHVVSKKGIELHVKRITGNQIKLSLTWETDIEYEYHSYMYIDTFVPNCLIEDIQFVSFHNTLDYSNSNLNFDLGFFTKNDFMINIWDYFDYTQQDVYFTINKPNIASNIDMKILNNSNLYIETNLRGIEYTIEVVANYVYDVMFYNTITFKIEELLEIKPFQNHIHVNNLILHSFECNLSEFYNAQQDILLFDVYSNNSLINNSNILNIIGTLNGNIYDINIVAYYSNLKDSTYNDDLVFHVNEVQSIQNYSNIVFINSLIQNTTIELFNYYNIPQSNYHLISFTCNNLPYHYSNIDISSQQNGTTYDINIGCMYSEFPQNTLNSNLTLRIDQVQKIETYADNEIYVNSNDTIHLFDYYNIREQDSQLVSFQIFNDISNIASINDDYNLYFSSNLDSYSNNIIIGAFYTGFYDISLNSNLTFRII